MISALPSLRENPLAQAFRLPSFEFPYAAIRYTRDKTFTVGAGAGVYSQQIQLDRDADMLINELAFGIGAANPGTITARFKTNDGKRMSYDLIPVEELSGPLFPPMLMDAGTNLYVDLFNSGAGSIDVQVLLKGWRQYQPVTPQPCVQGFVPEEYLPLWQRYSAAPEGWHDEPYVYPFILTCASGAQKLKQPLPMDDDAVFLWRGISGIDALGGGGGLQKFIFWDAWGNPLSSDFVVQANELGPGGICRPIYPEVVCPASSVPQVDQAEYTGGGDAETRVSLVGVKRFRD